MLMLSSLLLNLFARFPFFFIYYILDAREEKMRVLRLKWVWQYRERGMVPFLYLLSNFFFSPWIFIAYILKSWAGKPSPRTSENSTDLNQVWYYNLKKSASTNLWNLWTDKALSVTKAQPILCMRFEQINFRGYWFFCLLVCLFPTIVFKCYNESVPLLFPNCYLTTM